MAARSAVGADDAENDRTADDEAATLRAGSAQKSDSAKTAETSVDSAAASAVEIDLSAGSESAKGAQTADASKPTGAPVTGPVTTGALHGRREERPAAKVNADEASALEMLVQRAMEPMLRDWLDKNMQRIVEEVAAKEVQRLSEKS